MRTGRAISHTFDAPGRETLIQNISAAGVAQAVFTNTYSATNNRLTVQELDGTRVTFGYDVTSQLTLEQRSGAQAYDIGYSYDRAGNRLTQTSKRSAVEIAFRNNLLIQYNAANAQVLITPPTGAPTTQTFDPVGNLTIQNTGGADSEVVAASCSSNHANPGMIWSPENRLLSISNPDGSGEQSTYSADGLRKSRTSGGVTTNFTWDAQNLLMETDTSNVIQARYTDFPGYWGGLTSQNRSGTSSFYGYDSQGSVCILTNSAGTPTDSYVYTAFGVELLNGSGTINPFQYIGLYGYYMTFINLYYVRARWLDAVKGRWDSRDPIGFDGGDWNLTRYCNNIPSCVIEPTGTQISFGDGLLSIWDRTMRFISDPEGNDPWTAVGKKIWRRGKRIAIEFIDNCLIPNLPYLPCTDCASAILSEWQGDPKIWNVKRGTYPVKPGGQPPQHVCNPDYAHCMACCTLSRASDFLCALSSQAFQNSRYNAGPAKAKRRDDACRIGIAVSFADNISCHSQCSTIFDDWKNKVDPVYKGNRFCNDLHRSRREIPFKPSMGLPPLLECNYIQ